MASDHETIFTMEATPVKFGSGASADAGWELKRHRHDPHAWPTFKHVPEAYD
jgi:hypothetical protein